jgi:hypothetical protein
LKPVFIIAVVFSVAIALVGVVAMTNTADAELFDINRPMSLTQFVQQVSENAAEANKAITEAKRIEVVAERDVANAKSKYHAAIAEYKAAAEVKRIEVAEAKLAKAKVAADKAEDGPGKVSIAEAKRIEALAERDVAKAKSKYHAAIAEYKAAENAKINVEPRVIKYNEAMAKAIAESNSGKSAEQAQYNKYKAVVDKAAAEVKRIEVAEAKLAIAESKYHAAIAEYKAAENIASYNTYKADGAAQAPARDYGSSTYNAPQAPTTNYGSAEPYVPPKLDFKPIQIPEPKYQFKEPDRSVITDHKLDIPNFKPNPIPKSMPIPPSINPAKQFVYDNPGRDIVLSRENPGIPNSAWNP